MRLALELHEVKSTSAKAREEAAEARTALLAVDNLRDALAESSAGMAAARAEVRCSSAARPAAAQHSQLARTPPAHPRPLNTRAAPRSVSVHREAAARQVFSMGAR